MSYQPPIEIDLSEAVVLVNRYSDEFKNEDGTPNDEIVAVNLGWTLEQLQEFRHDFEDLLEAEKEIAKLAPPKVRAPTDIDVMLPGPGSLPKEAPQLNDIAQAVEAADTALRKGFHNLGLTSREVEEAVAMQKFNGQYFKESMDLSSCNVMRTSVRLATQQGLIQARLEFVREQIDRANKGALKETGLTKEEQEARRIWVSEERQLVYQFTEIAELITKIADTWYNGAAKLALIKMKMRENGANENEAVNGAKIITQRKNRPSFRPQTTIEQ